MDTLPLWILTVANKRQILSVKIIPNAKVQRRQNAKSRKNKTSRLCNFVPSHSKNATGFKTST